MTYECDHEEVAGDERLVRQLLPAELMIVATLRAWVAPLRAPDRPHPPWREILGHSGVTAAGAVGFDLLMSVVAQNAIRLLDVRCCNCPGVGADEEVLLRLVGALQRGDSLEAIGGLSEWLAADNLSVALRGAQRFASQTAAAGMRVPRVMPEFMGWGGDMAAPAGRVLH